MKKIFNVTAMFLAMSFTLGATAFGACPLKTGHTACTMNNNYSGNITGAAAPISYIVAPTGRTFNMQPCDTCAQKAKQSIFSKMFTPIRNVSDAVIMPIFTQLY